MAVKKGDRRRMGVNRRKWDESVPLHLASPLYDVPSFLRGKSALEPFETREMGSVRGKSLLHLQCHFGMDTLSWARRGAKVTGVDFSLPAVKAARRLAQRARTPARFVHSNLYDAPDVLHEQFDIVYTGKGAICWLPDIEGWARVVSGFLKPGGKLYLLDDHPIVEVFPNEEGLTRLEPKIPYFVSRSIREEYDGTYATGAKMKHRVSYSWIHPASKLLSALIDSGLTIEQVREYPYTFWRRYLFMHTDRSGYWHLNGSDGLIPLMWSVQARKM